MTDLYASSTRCLLVQPEFSPHSFWNYKQVCDFVGAKYPAPPLGLMTVAALLPQHWQFRLVDENVSPLTDDDIRWAQMVMVTGMLPQQAGILRTIERAHEHGVPVVVGGPDATSQPEVYAAADFLVLGEGEVTIPRFLDDVRGGATSGRYAPDGYADMARAVVPRFDLVSPGDYLMMGVQFSRGCPFQCEFCDVIELFGRRPRAKNPGQIIRELEALYALGHRGHVDFVDDNLVGNKPRLIGLLEALRDWSRQRGHPFYFSTEASINLADEPELLSLMRDNDFRYVFVGIETPDQDALLAAHKTQNAHVDVARAVATLASHGMIVNGGFILGFDGESAHVGDDMLALIEDAGICLAMVGRLCALPNTKMARRLKREGRLYLGKDTQTLLANGVDQTTEGLNFCTVRPRMAILDDHRRIVERIYAPQSYFARIRRTADQLKPAHQHRPDFRTALKLARAFLRVSAKMTLSRRTRAHYWKTVVKTLLYKPQTVDVVVNMSAMYVHLAEQSKCVLRSVTREMSRLQELGEAEYDRLMLGNCASGAEEPTSSVPALPRGDSATWSSR